MRNPFDAIVSDWQRLVSKKTKLSMKSHHVDILGQQYFGEERGRREGEKEEEGRRGKEEENGEEGGRGGTVRRRERRREGGIRGREGEGGR